MHGAGILRFQKNNERSIASGSASEADWFRRLTREFVRPMADAITAYKDYYKGRRGKPSACLSHLSLLTSEQAAYISMKTIFDSMSGELKPAQAIAMTIGRRIEDEVRFTKLGFAAPEYIGAIRKSLQKRANQSYKFEKDSLVHAERELKLLGDFQKLRAGGVAEAEIKRLLNIRNDKYAQLLDKEEFAIDYDRWINWPNADIVQLGAKMIDIFANNVRLNGQPLIQKRNINLSTSGNHSTPIAIVPTDALEAWIGEYKEVMGCLSPAYEPCIVPPRDWKTPFHGGYHTQQVSSRLHLVKCKSKKHLRRLTRKQMPEHYQAVNALQRVKWRINESILAVANEARMRQLPYGLPSMVKQEKPVCPVPAIYADLRGKELTDALNEEQREEFRKWKADSAAYYTQEHKRKADVREALATIDQGFKFKDYENLHFVYTLDFRGRVYAQGSLVSPQGGDLQKALIHFAEPEALGEQGYYWFCVQGANVWGWDKESFAERVSRVRQEDFKEMCLDIAADPLTFTEWTQADKPWQFLSWCFEYAELLEWVDNGNDATEYCTRIAVAMDGSCSGIQHYSAMLRDAVGGREVNLLPSDKPRDIYGAVATVVVDWMTAIIDSKEDDFPHYDAMLENLICKLGEVQNAEQKARVLAYKFAEEWLRIGVTRSMTKKPVMTLPYGSSQLTCRDSIADYLQDLQSKSDKKALASGKATGNIHNFDEELPRNDAISFASMMTWKGIGEVVVAAREGMAFIKGITNEVASENQALEWKTPTGFIVLQEIFETTEEKVVHTSMLGKSSFRIKEDTKDIDKRRMSSSAAPNFVHSMDASHLVLAVCAFDNAGIKNIAVIHDSFGTTAGFTVQLRELLAGSFVRMYQEHDVISDFKSYNEERLLMALATPLPTKGDLDLNDVMKSEYCFA